MSVPVEYFRSVIFKDSCVIDQRKIDKEKDKRIKRGNSKTQYLESNLCSGLQGSELRVRGKYNEGWRERQFGSHHTPPLGGQMSSFTFQKPSYDVVNIKFVWFSHRAGVLCASRASHGAPSFEDDLWFSLISLVWYAALNCIRGFGQYTRNGRPDNRALHSLLPPPRVRAPSVR